MLHSAKVSEFSWRGTILISVFIRGQKGYVKGMKCLNSSRILIC